MNYLDLFSGVGGFSQGFKQAGWKFDKHYFSEIDKYAKKIYAKHFPEAVDLGDVRTIGEGLGDIDLITFGFPCQDLSIAGKREGLGGSRSGLFFEATRIIRLYRPRIFIFENVEGLLTSNEGKDFEIVLREIADIGLYECEWQLLNTSWFLPQNRERVYFIGHLAGTGGRKVFPITERGEADIELPTLTARYWGGQANGGYLRDITKQRPQAERIRGTDGDAVTLQGLAGGGGAKTGLYCVAMRGRENGQELEKRVDAEAKTNTLTGVQKDNFIISNMRIRRLTPTEACRLQGFSDDWVDGISDAQKYRCLGNAVTVDVVKEIAERLKG